MPIDRVHLPPPPPPFSSPVPIARYPLTRGVSLTLSFRSRFSSPVPFRRPLYPSAVVCTRTSYPSRPVPSRPSPSPSPFHPILSRSISSRPVPFHPILFQLLLPPTPTLCPSSSSNEPTTESPFHLCQIDYASIHLLPPTDLNFSFSVRSSRVALLSARIRIHHVSSSYSNKPRYRYGVRFARDSIRSCLLSPRGNELIPAFVRVPRSTLSALTCTLTFTRTRTSSRTRIHQQIRDSALINFDSENDPNEQRRAYLCEFIVPSVSLRNANGSFILGNTRNIPWLVSSTFELHHDGRT